MVKSISPKLKKEIFKLAKKKFAVTDQTSIIRGPLDTTNAQLPVYRFCVDVDDIQVTGYVGFDEPNNALNVWIASLL